MLCPGKCSSRSHRIHNVQQKRRIEGSTAGWDCLLEKLLPANRSSSVLMLNQDAICGWEDSYPQQRISELAKRGTQVLTRQTPQRFWESKLLAEESCWSSIPSEAE